MSFWTTHQHKIDRNNFRAQEQYLGNQDVAMLRNLYAYVIANHPDKLARMHEDGAFGCVTTEIDGRLVSRDLLDSIVELDFIEQTIGVPMTVLDIGAGYGRLAHRMGEVWPATAVVCTDAVPVSLEICASYIVHRDATMARVVRDAEGAYDLACNVHSWPECTRDEIRWWLSRLTAPHLFVVPHLDGEMLCNEDGRSFMPDILEHGYRVLRHWRGPECWVRDFYMFERGR